MGASSAPERSSGNNNFPARCVGRTGWPATKADHTFASRRQFYFQVLQPVVADAQHHLRHHLSVVRHDSREPRVIHQGL